MRSLLVAGLAAVAGLIADNATSAGITVETVPVGNPGNSPDPSIFSRQSGDVSYNYSIGKYDITAGQYTAFLNAVATQSDTFGLYNQFMSSTVPFACGIQAQLSNGQVAYSTTRNPNYPVNGVTYLNALRFANWMSNGQPTGPEGAGTTDTGSYTLNSATTVSTSVTRNPNATWVLPTLQEWYKAAYYNPTNNTYWAYATQNNIGPSNVLSTTGTNNANYSSPNFGNYSDPTNILTPVGYFAGSVGPYGTFDQAGDVRQWLQNPLGLAMGGAYSDTGTTGLSSDAGVNDDPNTTFDAVGFRVALVPEPASLGLFGLTAIGLLSRRRSKKN